jgi:hemoglobin
LASSLTPDETTDMTISHLPFSIGAAERDQRLLCMNQALGEVVKDVTLREELSAAFAKVADHMRNREQ